jgi:hypothetical protein
MDEISYPLEVAQRIGADLRAFRAENERLRAAVEQAASIAFNGVEEEGYPGSIDRRPETLRNAILALAKKDRPGNP